MTLKDQLEGKPRRRTVYLVEVADPAAAEAALGRADQALTLLELASADTPEAAAALEQARAAKAAALVARDACYLRVEFQALPDTAMEELAASTLTPKGDYDRHRLAPRLAAACAVDEDLRDVDWWTTQLASDAWSQGEFDGLYNALIALNWRTPPEGLPKD